MWLRLVYWWGSAATGSYIPYIALYFKQIGLSGLQIGVLTSIPPIGPALLAPTWGVIADSLSAHRLALRIAALAAAGSALLLSQTTSFGPILLLVAMLALFTAPISPLIDSYGVSISERLRMAYGSFRFWGAFGYMAASWLVGRWMGQNVSERFLFAYAGGFLLLFFSSLGLPRLKPRPHKAVRHAFGTILRQPPVLLVLLTSYLVSSATGVMYNYLGIYLNQLGGSTQLIGTAFALNALSELPILAGSAWFFRRLGPQKMIAMAICFYIVRFVGYSFLPSAEWVLPLQLLHGLTYAVYVMGSVTLIHQLAGKELATTAQALLSSMWVGFGMMTGSFLGGVMLDRVGAPHVVDLFRAATCVMALALVVYLVGLRSFARAREEPAG